MSELDEFLLEALDEELPGFKVPDLAQISDEHLIDKCGVIKDRRKRLEKYEKLLVAAIKGRDLQTGAKGNQFELERESVTSSRLSKDEAILRFGEEAVRECYVASTSDRVTIKRL